MDHTLDGCHVLVVDDNPMIAMSMAEELEAAGAIVVGPTSSIEGAQALLRREEVEAAVLDIRLDGQLVYPLADRLAAEGIPFIFATGMGIDEVPGKYACIPVYDKPFDNHSIIDAVAIMREKSAAIFLDRERLFVCLQ